MRVARHLKRSSPRPHRRAERTDWAWQVDTPTQLLSSRRHRTDPSSLSGHDKLKEAKSINTLIQAVLYLTFALFTLLPPLLRLRSWPLAVLVVAVDGHRRPRRGDTIGRPPHLAMVLTPPSTGTLTALTHSLRGCCSSPPPSPSSSWWPRASRPSCPSPWPVAYWSYTDTGAESSTATTSLSRLHRHQLRTSSPFSRGSRPWSTLSPHSHNSSTPSPPLRRQSLRSTLARVQWKRSRVSSRPRRALRRVEG
jgi:hypothetical protein